MSRSLCLHVDAHDPGRLRLALKNAKNYRASVGQAPVIVLVNGPGVRLFTTQDDELLAAATEFKQNGGNIQVCRNALKENGIDEASIWPCCEVIPAGIVALVELQAEGYAYVKP